MNNTRIEWIDTSKGLGMILVIAGHTIALKYSSVLYSFHMPLFFFLSGLVYNSLKYSSFKNLLKSKAAQILKPWLVCYLISLAVSITIPVWRNSLSWKQMLIELYTTNSNNINNSSIWYLVCLFVTFILLFLVHWLFRSISKRTTAIVLIVVGVLLLWIKEFLLIVSPFLHLIDNRLPLKLDSAMIAVIFMYIGFRYKDNILTLVSKTSVWKLIVAFVVFVIGYTINRWSNINSLDFGNVRLLYFPIAFLGIYCVMSFCYLVSTYKTKFSEYIRKMLSFYGVNSLIIFGFQSLFIRLYILFFNENFGYSMALYDNNPMIHQIGSFIIVTFIISPLIVYGFAYLRKHNIRIL